MRCSKHRSWYVEYPRCRRGVSAVDVLTAHRIRQRRLELALSEADAARGMGVSRSRLRALEGGLLRPSAKEIAGIAAVLRLSLSNLFLALGNSP